MVPESSGKPSQITPNPVRNKNTGEPHTRNQVHPTPTFETNTRNNRLLHFQTHTHTLTKALRQSPITLCWERRYHCRIAATEDEIKHALLTVEWEDANVRISW